VSSIGEVMVICLGGTMLDSLQDDVEDSQYL